MFIVIWFLFIVFETVQIVQLSCILWYKSNTSYAEVQVLTVVKGQAHIPSLKYSFLSRALVVIVESSLEFCTHFEVCFPVRLKQNRTLLTLDCFNALTVVSYLGFLSRLGPEKFEPFLPIVV